MRSIPSELKSKINKKCQTVYENANPKLKVLLSRGFLSELFQVYTIQEGAALEEIDVSVKRTNTSNEPAFAYALALDNGVAKVKSKPLPYDDQYPWTSEFTVDTGISSVAIEFDGGWIRDIKSKRFNFVTEDVPWIFFIKDGTLYAQYWQNGPTVLSTDADKVCAIRGWVPVDGDLENDQGLIAAYLKTDGTAWYRNYCIQASGEKEWEIERELTGFAGAATGIAVFRTNDFRIGFMIEAGGEVWWTLTDRNYAGMSYFPELLTGKFGGVTAIGLIEVEYADLTAPIERLSGSHNTLCIGLNLEADASGICTGAEITGESEITLKFSQKLAGDTSHIKDLITVSDETMTMYYTPVLAAAGETQYDLVITVLETLDTENASTVTVGDATIYLKPGGQGSMIPVAAFYVNASLLKDPYHFVNLSGSFDMMMVGITEIVYSDLANQEAAYLTGTFDGFTSIVLTKVGTGDV